MSLCDVRNMVARQGVVRKAARSCASLILMQSYPVYFEYKVWFNPRICCGITVLRYLQYQFWVNVSERIKEATITCLFNIV